MDSLELATYSEDELDYEYEDFETRPKIVSDTAEISPQNNDTTAALLVANSSLKDGAKRGVRLINSFLGGIDTELDDVSDMPLVARRPVITVAKHASRPSIHDRVKITAQRRLGAQRFGINLADDYNKVKSVLLPELQALFKSLDVDPDNIHLRTNAVFVYGVNKMSEFEVKRIFAEHRPESVQFVDNTSCTVRWKSLDEVALMFLDMTKCLRRVRTAKKAEEGELVESEDEEEIGQVKEENGEDIAVVTENVNKKTTSKKRKLGSVYNDVIEINIEEVNVPGGKWRVATKHVPNNRLILLRFATGFDVRRGVINSRVRPHITFPDEEKHNSIDNDGFEYAWKTGKNQVRPGLNIFDEKGKELEWDYEHDTRFFNHILGEDDDDDDDDENDDNNEKDDKNDDDNSIKDDFSKKKRKNDDGVSTCGGETLNFSVGNVQIRSRGRGSKKFLAAFTASPDSHDAQNSALLLADSATETLASDSVPVHNKYKNSTITKPLSSRVNSSRLFSRFRSDKNNLTEDSDEAESDDNIDIKLDIDPTPTPQPWN